MIYLAIIAALGCVVASLWLRLVVRGTKEDIERDLL